MNFKHKDFQLIFTILLSFVAIAVEGQAKDSLFLSVSRNMDKQIAIYPQEKIYLHTDKDVYIAGECIWFRTYIVEALTHKPISASRYAYTELINEHDSVVSRVKVKVDDNNIYQGFLSLPDHIKSGRYCVRAYTRYLCNEGDDYSYRKNVWVFNGEDTKSNVIKNEKDGYNVAFFPEGGNLLEGVMCRVAFKAINEMGLHETIEGELVDDENMLLEKIKCYHRGMGSFSFIPLAGKKYYVNCWNQQGVNKRFELPAASSDAFSLHIDSRNNRLFVSVLQSKDNADSDSLFLLIHKGGFVHYFSSVGKAASPLVFDQEQLVSGVTQILLFDRHFNPLSERLFFINNQDQASVDIKTEKGNYTTRELVKVKAKIRSMQDDIADGSLSVSVIDGNLVNPDTSITLLSTMLLTSELKGYIEDPGFYFRKEDKQATLALDILMMTQGWRRYNIPEVIKGNYKKPEILPESSQKISGSAISNGVLRNTALKNGKIMLFIPDAGFVDETQTDKSGRFCFEQLEFPDSLSYIVQASGRGGDDDIELELDKDAFPLVSKYPFWNTASLALNTTRITEEVRTKEEEENIRVIHLEEVKITAQKPFRRSMYAWTASQSFNSEYIREKNIQSVTDLAYKVPGARVGDGVVYLRSAGKPAVIIIDDQIMTRDDQDKGRVNKTDLSDIRLTDININDVERIDFVKSVGSVLLGSRGYFGAVVITTKKGSNRIARPENKLNVKTIIPLGYQLPAEFYSPKYETLEEKNKQEPDIRFTIYWKPDIILDGNGEAEFSFYTADTPSAYYLIMEGITSNGGLIHQVETIKVDH